MPQDDQKRAEKLLGESDLLSSLPAQEIVELARHARRVHFDADETLFAKGSPGTHAYWILKGRIKVSTSARNGSELLLAMVDAGGHCGDISAIEGGPRSSHAVAELPSDTLCLHRRDLLAAIERNPTTAMKVVHILAEHIRQAVVNIEILGLHSSETRIWCRLIDLSHRYPGSDALPGSVRIKHGLSQQSLADSVGLTRVVMNRQLSAWRDQGLIQYSRGVLVIPDPLAFEAYVWRVPKWK